MMGREPASAPPSLCETISLIRDWQARAPGCRRVLFREPVPIPPGPGDDYNVIYEAIFEPPEVTKARLELWVTDDGYVGVLFEKRERLARRLAKRRMSHRLSPLGGHEPAVLHGGGLRALLDAVSNGEIGVIYTEALGMVFNIGCVMQQQNRKRLAASGYDVLAFWLRVSSDAGIAKTSGLRRSVVYDPW